MTRQELFFACGVCLVVGAAVGMAYANKSSGGKEITSYHNRDLKDMSNEELIGALLDQRGYQWNYNVATRLQKLKSIYDSAITRDQVIAELQKEVASI